MTYFEIFLAELNRYDVDWCFGQCGARSSHKRGFVQRGQRTVHLDSKITTRSALMRGLHEIAHCVLDEQGMRRYQREAQAEAFAAQRLRELGVAVPRKARQAGQSYVARMKRFGDRVRDGRRKPLRSVVGSK